MTRRQKCLVWSAVGVWFAIMTTVFVIVALCYLADGNPVNGWMCARDAAIWGFISAVAFALVGGPFVVLVLDESEKQS